ncbi:flagellar hook-length control protein FliK [Sphingosinicella sp. CPCC 101087]|uniref:flagellar hook-length control protein FliK n=1 Tax=Sphingosinicella sp. CPCC 101087 TaxID=2497754 RepID=UPI001FB12548|nr:flagellar hook-length control protein FliK [Sphingosinicella sp. CPCC 101087]
MASVPNMRLGPTARPGVSEQPGEGGESEGFAQLLSTTLPVPGAAGPRAEAGEDPDADRPAIGDEGTPIAQADAILSLVAMQAAPNPAPAPTRIATAAGAGSAAPAAAPDLAFAASAPAATNLATTSAPVAAGTVTVPAPTPDTAFSTSNNVAWASEAAAEPAAGQVSTGAGAPYPDGQVPAGSFASRPGAVAAAASTAAGPAVKTEGPAAATVAIAATAPTAPHSAGGAMVAALQPSRTSRGPAANVRPAADYEPAGTNPENAAADPASAQAMPQGPRRPSQPASNLAQPKGDVAAQAPVQPGSAAVPFALPGVAEPAAPGQIPAAPASAAGAPEAMVERQLELAADGEWLDRLARDIADAGSTEGKMRFRLDPEHLGTLKVELTQGDRGTSVRLTVESEAARAIIAEAQPKLVAEARAQGVRIAETHVDLAGGHAGDPRRQEAERREPQLRTGRDTVSEAEPERRTRSSSDRYA